MQEEFHQFEKDIIHWLSKNKKLEEDFLTIVGKSISKATKSDEFRDGEFSDRFWLIFAFLDNKETTALSSMLSSLRQGKENKYSLERALRLYYFVKVDEEFHEAALAIDLCLFGTGNKGRRTFRSEIGKSPETRIYEDGQYKFQKSASAGSGDDRLATQERDHDSVLKPSFPSGIVLPGSYQKERDEFQEAKSALLSKSSKSLAITAVVQGIGGYGKTSLAEEICLDASMRNAFPGGIYWLQFGLVESGADKAKQKTLTACDAISSMLKNQYGEGQKLEIDYRDDKSAVKSLLGKLPNEPLLLVADDLWTETQAEWISECENNVSLIATTRTKSLGSKFGRSIEIKRLCSEASLKLLLNGIKGLDQEQLATVKKISIGFGGWPLLLKLANSTFRYRQKFGKSNQDFISDLESFIELEEVTGWDDPKIGEAASEKRRHFVGHCISAGVSALPNRTYKNALFALGVFPDDTDIPFSVISSYWAELTKDDDPQYKIAVQRAESIRTALHDLSFFNKYDPDSKTLQVHDVFLAYFRNSHSPDALESLHQALLASFKSKCCEGWSGLPSCYKYCWKHLLYHLEAQRLDKEADDLRVDYYWLNKKFQILGLQELQRSFVPLPKRADARLVGHAIKKSAPALQECPKSFAHQMYGRLAHYEEPALVSFLQDLHSDEWFYPVFTNPHLKAPNGELMRLTGIDDIQSIKVDFFGNSRFLYVAISNGRVFIWDLWKNEICWDSGYGNGFRQAPEFSPNVEKVFCKFGGSSQWTIYCFKKNAIHKWFPENLRSVRRAVFSNDARKLFTYGDDNQLQIWHLDKSLPPVQLEGHTGKVRYACFSPNDSKIVTASKDHTAIIWNAKNGRLIARLEEHTERVNCAVFSNSGRFVLTASDDGSVIVWCALKGLQVERYPRRMGHAISKAKFSHDDEKIIVTERRGSAIVYERGTSRIIADLPNLRMLVERVEFTPDGRKFALSGFPNYAALVHAPLNEIVMKTPNHTAFITDISISQDEKFVATATRDGTVSIWDSTHVDDREDDETEVPLSDPGGILEFDNNAKYLAAMNQRSIRIFRTDNMNEKKCFELELSSGWYEIFWTANVYVFWTLRNHTVFQTNIDTKRESAIARISGDVEFAMFNRSKQRLLIYDETGVFTVIDKVWRFNRVRHIDANIERTGSKGLSYLSMSSDAKFAAAVSCDGNVVVWDLSYGRKCFEIECLGQRISVAYFFSGSRYIFVAGRQRCQIFDTKTRSFVQNVRKKNLFFDVISIAVSPCENIVAFTDPRVDAFSIWHWRENKFHELGIDKIGNRTLSRRSIVRFSAGGDYLFVVNGDCYLRSWLTASMRPLRNVKFDARIISMDVFKNRVAVYLEDTTVCIMQF